jgi:hypothetical protein
VNKPKPCPFCGKPPYIEDHHHTFLRSYRVLCWNYDCHIMPVAFAYSREWAMRKWNKRK